MTNIEAIMVVKDEADVLEAVLRGAHRWCSRINVLDNGSVDGTWELLQDLSSTMPRLNVLGQVHGPFRDRLRADVFQEVRRTAPDADWWARLDADEFHIVDPRVTLGAIPRWHDAVLGSMYQFYLTDVDVALIQGDRDDWLRAPLQQRLRWYSNNWMELRFVRASTTRRWTETPWPEGTLRIATVSAPIRHYQYRSPDQIARRMASRSRLEEFVHERSRGGSTPESWEHVAVPHARLDYDDSIGPLIARQSVQQSLAERLRRQAGWLTRTASRAQSGEVHGPRWTKHSAVHPRE